MFTRPSRLFIDPLGRAGEPLTGLKAAIDRCKHTRPYTGWKVVLLVRPYYRLVLLQCLHPLVLSFVSAFFTARCSTAAFFCTTFCCWILLPSFLHAPLPIEHLKHPALSSLFLSCTLSLIVLYAQIDSDESRQRVFQQMIKLGGGQVLEFHADGAVPPVRQTCLASKAYQVVVLSSVCFLVLAFCCQLSVDCNVLVNECCCFRVVLRTAPCAAHF